MVNLVCDHAMYAGKKPEARMKFTSIGIPALDEHLGGGIQKGSTVLVIGTPGSGRVLREAVRVRRPGDCHLLHLDREGRGCPQRHARVRLEDRLEDRERGHPLLREGAREEAGHQQVPAGGVTLGTSGSSRRGHDEGGELPHVLAYEISKLDPPFRVVINSLDFFLENYESSEVLMAMRTIKAHTQHSESVTLMTMLKGFTSRGFRAASRTSRTSYSSSIARR